MNTTTFHFHILSRPTGAGVEWRVIATAAADATGRRFRHDHAVVTETEEAPASIVRLRDRIAEAGVNPVGRAHWEETRGVSLALDAEDD